MASDIARVSYDESRRYHAVVKQQGRVELEADENEATTIIDELLRRETIDIIGPTGSPDDGYQITAAAAGGDFSIGAGTIYVGGMRVNQPDEALTYTTQKDWLDRWPSPDAEALGDPVWIDPAAPGLPHELVYLFLREQDSGAVEDMTLREVALGGPDTAQRKRLIARVVRRGANDGTCEGAMGQMISGWPGQGLEFDPATMRLTGIARLQASYTNPNPASDPCEPDAHGGYLAAENQLLRVQIAQGNKFVWGYDNASFLYRVTVESTGANPTLRLQSAPVDSHHFPAAGQAVELLLPAVDLGDDNFVAAHTGHIDVLSSGYTPDTRTVQLANALPAQYQPATGDFLFMRVWQEAETLVPGTDVTLGDTGLKVNITGAAFHAGDYWMIALRPETPTEVYPNRYLVGPQPPDGPRIWITPLALDYNDCREPFDNLVELTKRKAGGCCTYTVTTVNELRDAVQNALARAPRADGTLEPVRICILPGTYALETPILLQGTSDVVISGCGAQTLVTSSHGALVILDCARVTLDGLTIRSSRQNTPTVTAGWSTELRILNCDIAATGDGPATAVLPGGSDIIIKECELAGGPALAASGSAIRIMGNRMRGGGVWLGEGSADVLIRDNCIGSGSTESPWPGVLIGGPFVNRYDPTNSLETAPETRADTRISRVEIASNRIEGLTGSGITTFVPRGDGIGLLTGITIGDNEIIGCATSDDARTFDAEAIGGIVLRDVEGVIVSRNEIRQNGVPEKLRTCGVFVRQCTSVRLDGNRVVDNGWSNEPADGLFQGGIIVLDAWPDASDEVGRGPAVIAHDNFVVSPMGQSLLIDAVGPVSVVGNSLNSRSITQQPISDAELGLAVFIRSLGTPIERKLRDVLSAGNVHALLGPGLGALLDGDRWPDGRVLVSDNQMSSRIIGGREGDAAVAVHSLDDVSFQDNQLRLDEVEGLLTDVAVIGATVRALGNRIAEPEGVGAGTFFSYLSTGAYNIATGNQVTHCLFVGGAHPVEQLNQVLYPQGCERIVASINEPPSVQPGDDVRPYWTTLNGLNTQRVRAQLAELAERAADRAGRLRSVVENAATTLGRDDPRTTSMAERAEAAKTLMSALKVRAASLRDAPKLEAGGAVIHGRITDPKGQPLEGLKVQVVPPGDSPRGEPREVTSNDDGTFEIRYSPDEVEKLREAGQTLALSVRLTARKALTSDDPITLTSNSVEYFDVVVLKPRRTGGTG